MSGKVAACAKIVDAMNYVPVHYSCLFVLIFLLINWTIFEKIFFSRAPSLFSPVSSSENKHSIHWYSLAGWEVWHHAVDSERVGVGFQNQRLWAKSMWTVKNACGCITLAFNLRGVSSPSKSFFRRHTSNLTSSLDLMCFFTVAETSGRGIQTSESSFFLSFTKIWKQYKNAST